MSDAASRFAVVPGLRVRCWAGEATGIVFAPDGPRTHLVNAEAAALLLADEGGLAAAPPQLIDGLLQAGLLRRQP